MSNRKRVLWIETALVAAVLVLSGSATGQNAADGWAGPRADLLPREECLNCRNWSFSPSRSAESSDPIDVLEARCTGLPDDLQSDQAYEFCDMALLFSDGSCEVYSVWSVQQFLEPQRGTRYRYSSSRLVARDRDTDETVAIFEVRVGSPIAYSGLATAAVDTPLGTLVRVPLIFEGTGYFNEDFHFWWDGRDLIELDETSWVGDFELPDGLTLNKGYVFDVETQSVWFEAWPKDGSDRSVRGGTYRIVFGGLEGRKLVIEDVSFTPHPEH